MLQKIYLYMQQIKNNNVSVLFINILYCFKLKKSNVKNNFNIFTILIIIKNTRFSNHGFEEGAFKNKLYVYLSLQKLYTIHIVRLQYQTFNV